MRSRAVTAGYAVGISLLLLSLVTPFLALGAYSPSVHQYYNDPYQQDGPPSSATIYEMENLSTGEQEIAKKAIECDGEITVYARGYDSLPSFFDNFVSGGDAHAKHYGKHVEYEGEIYRIAISTPGGWDIGLPSFSTLWSFVSLALSLVILSKIKRAKHNDSLNHAWIFAIGGFILILLLLWVGNYHRYLWPVSSC